MSATLGGLVMAVVDSGTDETIQRHNHNTNRHLVVFPFRIQAFDICP